MAKEMTFLNWLLPDSQLSTQKRMRLNALVFFLFFAFLVGVYSLIKWSKLGNSALVYSSVILLLILAISFVLIKTNQNAVVTANLAILGMTIHSFNISYQLGGIHSAHILWPAGIVVFAYLLANNRSGLFWFFAGFVQYIYLIAIDHGGTQPTAFPLDAAAIKINDYSGYLLPLFMIWLAQSYLHRLRGITMEEVYSLRDEAEKTAAKAKTQAERLSVLVSNVSETAHTLNSLKTELTQTVSSNSRLGNQITSELDEQSQLSSQMQSDINATLDTVKHSSALFNTLDNLSNIASQLATSANQQMQLAVQTITQTREHSMDIREAVAVISSIADQTNLLALNAAIESARAGEAGRGFAVVADEVRNLSIKSNESATKIAELIETSSNNMETGYKQVHNAESSVGEALEKFSEMTREITQLLGVADQQSHLIGEVAGHSQRVDQLSQQSASAAHQLLEANRTLEVIVSTLSNQADKLETQLDSSLDSETT